MFFRVRRKLNSVNQPEQKAAGREKGTALIECAIALPALAILIIGLVDISVLILNYMMLEQAAREGVRFSGSQPFLENTGVSSTAGEHGFTDLLSTVGTYTNCINSNSPSPERCGHVYTQSRIRHILVAHNLIRIQPFDVSITTFHDDTNDSVAVRLRGMYEPIFAPKALLLNWDGFPVTIEYQGPYMF